ncbi:thioredoxin domain-containing protein [Exiguobacterium mexicanum]
MDLKKIKNKKWIFLSISLIFTLLLFFILNYSVDKDNDYQKIVFSDALLLNQPSLGNTDAENIVIIFSDFKCPACVRWHKEVFPKLKKELIDTNQVRFIHINTMFNGKESTLAAMSAEVVFSHSSKDYWRYHSELYSFFPKEITESTLENFVYSFSFANKETLSLDFSTINHEVERDYNIGKENGIKETPSVFLNGEKLENPFNYNELKRKINSNH